MKKLFTLLFILCLACNAYAADSKLSDLAADATPSTDSLLYTVDDPGGTPASKKSTIAQVLVDGNIPDTITIDLATLASTVTVVDGTDTTSFPLIADSVTGSLPVKTDAGLTYNAGTASLATTTFVGALTGNADTATTASAGDSATAFFSSGTIEAAYGGTGANNATGSGRLLIGDGISSFTDQTMGGDATITDDGTVTVVDDSHNHVYSNIDETTSANWISRVSDETGTGVWVFNNTPTLVTPVLGAATATTINKVTITAPATASTLTIADGKTLTATNTVDLDSFTDEQICNYEATGTKINCDIAIDATAECAASSICGGGHEHEGSKILSTGEAGGTKFLREDGDGTSSWQSVAGSGDVTSVGDCTDGACYDGSADGGTYARYYDGDSHYGAFVTANLAANRTYTFGDLSLTFDQSVASGATPTFDAANFTGIPAGAYDAASIDGDDINSNIAGRSLTLTGASPDTLDADAELYTHTKCVLIETPTDADNFMFYHVELGSQVTRVHCIVEDATSATIEMEQCDVAGDNCTVITTALVCDVGGQEDDGTIDNPDLDVDDWVRMDVTATSGTPGAVTGCITFTMDD